MFSAEDHDYMQRALDLAARGLFTTTPNPRVGCVLVRDNAIIGEGFTQPAGQNHAEIEALHDARQKGLEVRGATVYVSLEPCSHFGRTPPCVNALIDAGVTRVVAAMEDPNPQVSGKGLELLREAGIEVRCGLLEKEARELNLGFVSRMTRHRPWVRAKLAASLDAKSALSDGQSQWITSEAARRDGHSWRARACAVLTGIGTVRQDDPLLSVRFVETSRQPGRIVVDSRLEISLDSKLVRSAGVGGDLIIAHAVHREDVEEQLRVRGCELVYLPDANRKVDLMALMGELARRGMNEVHVEAGGKLNGSLLRAGCLDELIVYLAPTLLGNAQAMIELPAPATLDQRVQFSFREVEIVGDDIRLIARLTEELGEGND
ncbi:MAG: bifunctional diaminohydroxyphosphoribosylaminopyrimidine deaminase/5-amino-6-(5-phosphoribosylamino)uracil reductase RibD [Burkholderiaceae bacterium]|jgi:diaminohydroxyphosphoribosylaminopyrimidine deaminase/5-amino-6-(5-phosphoribosylamino)uracil reductase